MTVGLPWLARRRWNVHSYRHRHFHCQSSSHTYCYRLTISDGSIEAKIQPCTTNQQYACHCDSVTQTHGLKSSSETKQYEKKKKRGCQDRWPIQVLFWWRMMHTAAMAVWAPASWDDPRNQLCPASWEAPACWPRPAAQHHGARLPAAGWSALVGPRPCAHGRCLAGQATGHATGGTWYRWVDHWQQWAGSCLIMIESWSLKPRELALTCDKVTQAGKMLKKSKAHHQGRSSHTVTFPANMTFIVPAVYVKITYQKVWAWTQFVLF